MLVNETFLKQVSTLKETITAMEEAQYLEEKYAIEFVEECSHIVNSYKMLCNTLIEEKIELSEYFVEMLYTEDELRNLLEKGIIKYSQLKNKSRYLTRKALLLDIENIRYVPIRYFDDLEFILEVASIIYFDITKYEKLIKHLVPIEQGYLMKLIQMCEIFKKESMDNGKLK